MKTESHQTKRSTRCKKWSWMMATERLGVELVGRTSRVRFYYNQKRGALWHKQIKLRMTMEHDDKAPMYWVSMAFGVGEEENTFTRSLRAKSLSRPSTNFNSRALLDLPAFMYSISTSTTHSAHEICGDLQDPACNYLVSCIRDLRHPC